MRIIIAKDYEEMSKRAANIMAGQIYLKPNTVLGLATGSTPIGMYKELVRMYNEEGLDFKDVKTFNLDEYVGLPESDVNSYHYFMNSNLFSHVNLKKENINVPNGNAKDMEKEFTDYENKINAAGGVDLQVLGIGNNGHIGFNEPELKFEAATHLVSLNEGTIKANSRFFKSIDEVPKQAVSMGIKTIMRAKKIILLANGKGKAQAIYNTVLGAITPEVPASVLQLHPDTTIIVDEEAASMIKDKIK